MKHFFITAFILMGFAVSTVSAENKSKDIESLKTEVSSLMNRQKHLESEVGTLSSKTSDAEKKISDLSSQNKELQSVGQLARRQQRSCRRSAYKQKGTL